LEKVAVEMRFGWLVNYWFAGVRFFVRSMVFAIVQLVCKPVPQQHATFELFEQSGAAVHLALCKTSMPLCAIGGLAKGLWERVLVGLVEDLGLTVITSCWSFSATLRKIGFGHSDQ